MIETKQRPVSTRIRELRALDIHSVALTGLFILACVFFLRQAQDFVVPLTLAVLLHFLLMPVVRWFKRRRIAEPIAATVSANGANW